MAKELSGTHDEYSGYKSVHRIRLHNPDGLALFLASFRQFDEIKPKRDCSGKSLTLGGSSPCITSRLSFRPVGVNFFFSLHNQTAHSFPLKKSYLTQEYRNYRASRSWRINFPAVMLMTLIETYKSLPDRHNSSPRIAVVTIETVDFILHRLIGSS